MKTASELPAESSNESVSEVRSFEHDPAVLAQFSECLGLTPSKLIERINARWDNVDKVKEETLVLLAREYARRGKDNLAWKLVLLICDRIRPSLERSVRLWRLTPVASEDLVESLITTIYDCVLDETDGERFWEIRFWVCYERRLLSALKRSRLSDDRVDSADFTDPGIEDELAKSAHGNVPWNDPSLRAVIAEGLAQLSGNVRTAFMLKHWAGFPEHSVDPDDQATISKIMGVTDRSVRNYLSRAEFQLRAWRRSERNELRTNGGNR